MATSGGRRRRGERSAGLPYALYRATGHAFWPFLGVWLRRRARRGKEVRARIPERYGRASTARPDGPLVWLHAASVGELNSVLPLTERIRAMGLECLVTTGTVTSAKIAREKLPPGTIHQFQALDVPPAIASFLDHWTPDLAIFVESEIWPVTLHELAARGIAQVMVNGRMSDRSFRRWAKRPRLARALFGRLGHVLAQSDEDAERFRALGSPRVSEAGNLKADVEPPACDKPTLEELRTAIGSRPLWFAASLHPAEDALIADAVALLRLRHPGTLAIVAPRHPERGNAMRELLEERNLNIVQRSRGEDLTADTDILLADTLGEMGLWFRLAPVAFMGKSLDAANGAEGGQNPIEPALCGAAVLSGRAVANFREPYRLLLLDGGAKLVDDAPMLADFVAHLWQNEADLAAMQAGGRRTVERMAGALDRTLNLLQPWLAPLRMRAMLDHTRAINDTHVTGLSAARLRALREAEIAGRAPPTALRTPDLAAGE